MLRTQPNQASCNPGAWRCFRLAEIQSACVCNLTKAWAHVCCAAWPRWCTAPTSPSASLNQLSHGAGQVCSTSHTFLAAWHEQSDGSSPSCLRRRSLWVHAEPGRGVLCYAPTWLQVNIEKSAFCLSQSLPIVPLQCIQGLGLQIKLTSKPAYAATLRVTLCSKLLQLRIETSCIPRP